MDEDGCGVTADLVSTDLDLGHVDIATAPPSTSQQKAVLANSPQPSRKPADSLEAAMFLQMFPEQPKPAAKKTMAEMLAESSTTSSPLLPNSTAGDASQTSQKSEGLLLSRRAWWILDA